MTPQILPVVVKWECDFNDKRANTQLASQLRKRYSLPSPSFPTFPWGREQSPRF